MAWTYDSSDLVQGTASGNLNIVRLLIGDTSSADEQLMDEEINFALSEAGNNTYYAAAYCCRLLASKYARMVDTQLDGALEATYSDRIKHYNLLASQVEQMGKKASGKALGVFAGGITVSGVSAVNADTDRVKPAFRVGQFDNVEAGEQYIPDEPNGV